MKSTLGRQAIVGYVVYSVAVLLLMRLPCYAVEYQQSDSFVYRNSLFGTFIVSLLGLAPLGYGAYLMVASLRQAKRSKTRPRSPGRPGQPSLSVHAGIWVASGFFMFLGTLVLCLGIPGSRMKHITIGPDRVTIRDRWTSTSKKEILFSSIKGIEIRKEVGVPPEETLVIQYEGGVDRREMQALHKAAFPKLMERFEPYGGEQNAQNKRKNIAAKVDLESAIAQLTPVKVSGRFYSGSSVEVKTPETGRYVTAKILGVFAEGKLKVSLVLDPQEELLVDFSQARYVGLPFSQPPAPFEIGTKVTAGMTPSTDSPLLAFFRGRWYAVTLIKSKGKYSSVLCAGEAVPTMVPTNVLRIPPADGIELYSGKRALPTKPELLKPMGLNKNVGKEFYYQEWLEYHKVRVLMAYRDRVNKLRKVETSEEFYSFGSESLVSKLPPNAR